jgi:non-canonical (house-cleaning) NTP pyrophosphatase
MNIIACTVSKLKLQVIGEFFQPANITTYDTSKARVPEQPLNYGYFCCQENISLVKKQKVTEYDYIISIENIIDMLTQGLHHYYVETCYVIIEDTNGKQYRGVSFGIPIHKSDLQASRLTKPDEMDWLGQISRKDQIRSAIRDCLKHINTS